MKRIVDISLPKTLLILAAIIGCLMLVFPFFTVKAAYNRYKNRSYKTREEIDDLKQILEADGYIRVTKDMEGFEKLDNDKRFYNRGLYDEWNSQYYFVYVLKQDLEDYLKDEPDAISTLNANSILVSTYELDVMEDENMQGYIDGDIPDGWGKGLLTVMAETDDSREVIIEFRDTDRNLRYEFHLQKGSNWTVSHTIPEGSYRVEMVMSGEGTTLSYDTTLTSEGFHMSNNGFFTISIGVQDKSKIVTDKDTEKETDTIASDKNPAILESTDTNQKSPVNVSPAEEEKEDNKIIMLIAEIAMGLTVIIGGICILRHVKRKGDGTDTF